MPARLRPTAPIAADAILVGDPGRALFLAQELLEEPKMSNHARGLWGYSGRTTPGRELTIQATGMGGPSAAIVLTDLAELGVRRAVRVGTCTALDPSGGRPGELLVVAEALAEGGIVGTFGVAPNEAVLPDRDLAARLERELEDSGRVVSVASFDAMPRLDEPLPPGVAAADMQTATVLACGRSLGIAIAAVLIVTETTAEGRIDDEALEDAAKRAGRATERTLSS